MWKMLRYYADGPNPKTDRGPKKCISFTLSAPSLPLTTDLSSNWKDPIPPLTIQEVARGSIQFPLQLIALV